MHEKLRSLVIATAEAMANRKVPQTVIYSNGTADDGLGSNSDVQSLISTQLMKNLKALDLDMSVKTK